MTWVILVSIKKGQVITLVLSTLFLSNFIFSFSYQLLDARDSFLL